MTTASDPRQPGEPAATPGSSAGAAQRPAAYRPEVFRQRTLDGAKQIILQSAPDMTMAERWEKETDWLRGQWRFDAPDDLLLDFGCGVGRLARHLPNPIVGVDIAPEMRRHAEYYVDRPEFTAVDPDLFRRLVRSGLRFDGGYALWTLQHVFDPAAEIAFIAAALRPGARFWVLNTLQRCVPTDIGWVDDGKAIGPLLDRQFDRKLDIPVRRDVVNIESFLRCYRAR